MKICFEPDDPYHTAHGHLSMTGNTVATISFNYKTFPLDFIERINNFINESGIFRISFFGTNSFGKFSEFWFHGFPLFMGRNKKLIFIIETMFKKMGW